MSVVLCLVALLHAAPVDAERARVALLEERAGDAVASSRRAILDDPSWRHHLLYIKAGDLGGLGYQVAAEYTTVDEPLARLAWQLHQVVRGGEPPGVLDEPEAVALVDLAEGRPRAALRVLDGAAGGPFAQGLRVEALVLSDDPRGAARAAEEGLLTWPDHPQLTVGLWADPAPHRRVRRARRDALRAAGDLLRDSDATVAWRAYRLAIDARDDDLIEAAQARLGELGEAPPLGRRAWSKAMRIAVARALGDVQRHDHVPPCTPWERIDLARRVAGALADAGDLEAEELVWSSTRAQADSALAATRHGAALLRLDRREDAVAVAREARVLAALPDDRDLADLDQQRTLGDLGAAWALLARALPSDDPAAWRAVRVARALGVEHKLPALPDLGEVEQRYPERPDRAGATAAERALHEAQQALLDGDPGSALRAAHDAQLLAGPDEPGVLSVALVQEASLVDTADEALVLLTVAVTLHAQPPADWLTRRAELLEERGLLDAAFAWYAVAQGAGARDATPLERTWRGVGDWEDAAMAAVQRFQETHGLQARPPHPDRRRPPVRAGEPAPPWSVTAGEARLDHVTSQGNVVVLAFWASWCHPCQEELPELDALAGRLADEGAPVVFAAVSVDEQQRAFSRGAARLDLATVPVSWDPELGRTFGVRGLPMTCVIDAEGTARHVTSGYHRDAVRELEARVRALLPEE